MLQVLRENVLSKIVQLHSDNDKYLNWFKLFLNPFNGITFYNYRLFSDGVYEDGSLTGLGTYYGSMTYHMLVPLRYAQFNIVHLEMINIVVALKIWGNLWRDKKVKIHCDNLAVVGTLAAGKVRDNILATYILDSCLSGAIVQY